MRASVSQSKQFIDISFYKIDYDRIFSLLTLLKIEEISVFTEEIKGYRFLDSIPANAFMEYAVRLKESLLIFDGCVRECLVDKETEVLSERKIMIAIDPGENEATVAINKENAGISAEEIRQSFRMQRK